MNIAEEEDVDFNFDLLLTRDIESELNYSLVLTGIPGTAEEDDDFFVSNDVIYFPPDVSSINVSVVIRGDTIIELTEVFNVSLRQRGVPSFAVDLLSRTATIEITDNDGGKRKN